MLEALVFSAMFVSLLVLTGYVVTIAALFAINRTLDNLFWWGYRKKKR